MEAVEAVEGVQERAVSCGGGTCHKYKYWSAEGTGRAVSAPEGLLAGLNAQTWFP